MNQHMAATFGHGGKYVEQLPLPKKKRENRILFNFLLYKSHTRERRIILAGKMGSEIFIFFFSDKQSGNI